MGKILFIPSPLLPASHAIRWDDAGNSIQSCLNLRVLYCMTNLLPSDFARGVHEEGRTDALLHQGRCQSTLRSGEQIRTRGRGRLP